MVPVERIELPTFGLQNRCSTAELNRQLIDAWNRYYRIWLPPPGADGAGRRQISELAREGYWHEISPQSRGQRAVPDGEAGVCDGGSRARAMATRQASCELETVPSLHSNLGGAASATGGGFAVAAAGRGAGACAAGFWKSAQPVHETAIDRARTNRTRAASGTPPAADLAGIPLKPTGQRGAVAAYNARA